MHTLVDFTSRIAHASLMQPSTTVIPTYEPEQPLEGRSHSHFPALTLPISQPTSNGYPFLPLLLQQGASTPHSSAGLPFSSHSDFPSSSASPVSRISKPVCERVPKVALASQHRISSTQLQQQLRQSFEDEEDFYTYAKELFVDQAKETGCARIPEVKRGK